MIGPFKKAQGGYTHILVAIDKFTKLIEFKPIASLTSAKAVEFIQDIIFRFGIQNNIITDLDHIVLLKWMARKLGTHGI
jgi:hypothetical protein